jgi:RNA polymerase sigma factor (sigma-70 family)
MENTWTDEELLNGINKLDYAAIKEFHDRIMGSLYSFVFDFVNNMTEAERIASEAFTDSLLRCPIFKSLKHANNYVYKAAKNKSMTFLKSPAGKKQPIISQELSENIDNETEGSINKAEIIQQMHEQIKKLPPVKREIILYYLDGKKTSEIAQILQKSKQYVLNIKTKATKLLQNKLNIKP